MCCGCKDLEVFLEKEQIDQSLALKEGERRKGREERKERKVKSDKEG